MVCLSKLLEPLEKGLGIQFSGKLAQKRNLGTFVTWGAEYSAREKPQRQVASTLFSVKGFHISWSPRLYSIQKQMTLSTVYLNI